MAPESVKPLDESSPEDELVRLNPPVEQGREEERERKAKAARRGGPGGEQDEAPPPQADASARLLELVRNPKGELVATVSGRDEPITDVRVARCFPWTMPDALVSIRDKDGAEVALLQTLEDLPPGTRELIEQELRGKIFAPRIQRIISFEDRFGVATFHALTDRGEVKFQLNNSDDVRVLSGNRCVLKDVDGNIYEVPDATQLDRQSRQYLSEYF